MLKFVYSLPNKIFSTQNKYADLNELEFVCMCFKSILHILSKTSQTIKHLSVDENILSVLHTFIIALITKY